MYYRIFVPTDGSQLSERALREAGQLARNLGATLTLFHAIPTARSGRSRRARAMRLLDEAARKSGGTVTRRVCEPSDQPYEAIIAAAKKNHCDLIVMASHGWRGIKALVLGSETQKVLTHSRIPVLVVR